VKIGCGVRCAAAVGDENTAARSSNAAVPRLASRPGLDTHEVSELSRCTVMGASQQMDALGQPLLSSLHQKDRCRRYLAIGGHLGQGLNSTQPGQLSGLPRMTV
jgi:hypothetical protein